MKEDCKPETSWYTRKKWCAVHGKRWAWPCDYMVVSFLTPEEHKEYDALGWGMFLGTVTVASELRMAELADLALDRATQAGRI